MLFGVDAWVSNAMRMMINRFGFHGFVSTGTSHSTTIKSLIEYRIWFSFHALQIWTWMFFLLLLSVILRFLLFFNLCLFSNVYRAVRVWYTSFFFSNANHSITLIQLAPKVYIYIYYYFCSSSGTAWRIKSIERLWRVRKETSLKGSIGFE